MPLVDRARLPRPDVVFERGVLHTFTIQAGREAFAAAVADLLDPGGVWLDVSGSADTPGDPGEAARQGWPRLRLASIIAAEPYFQVLAMRQAAYGTTPRSPRSDASPSRVSSSGADQRRCSTPLLARQGSRR